MCGFDDGRHLVLEQLRAQAQAYAAVDATRGGELHHVNAACDVLAHGAPAVVGTTAQVVRLQCRMQLLTQPQGGIGVAGLSGNPHAGIQDARALHLASGHRVAQGQSDAIAVAQVAHRGKAGPQGLACIDQRIKRASCRGFGEIFHHALHAAQVGA